MFEIGERYKFVTLEFPDGTPSRVEFQGVVTGYEHPLLTIDCGGHPTVLNVAAATFAEATPAEYRGEKMEVVIETVSSFEKKKARKKPRLGTTA